MKHTKVLAILAMTIMTVLPMNVYAAETVITEGSQSASAEMNITAEKDSSFRVVVPDGFNMDAQTGVLDYQITASGDISSGKKLDVAPVDMYSTEDGDETSDINFLLKEVCSGISLKDPVVVKVTQEKTSLNTDELAAEGGATISGTMTAQSDIKAGAWSGTAGYRIELKDKE